MNRRHLLAVLLAAAGAAAAPACHAQAWPERPLRIVVASGAGSSLDALARAISERLPQRLGQPVVVENKPAAGGTVATAEVAKAAPDGYTMLLGFPGPLAFGPLLQKLPYDVQKDLAPVIITSNQPLVLAVNADLPVKSVPELVAYGKSHPGKLTYASVGNGSSSHLGIELLKSLAGFDALHVPFNGSPPAVLSTVQGETQMLLSVMQPLQAQVQAGKLRPIAVTTAKRFFLFPDLPSIAEAGYAGYELQGWNGIMVPAATPAPIVARLNAELNAVLKQPDLVQKMNGLGFELIGGAPEDFGALIRNDVARLTPVIRKVGLKVD
ncbi:MAG TPA: tripartite tricarboxylate transporter substrate binding protein [Casimicrobiaceae bacterium]|nr:tripartite tricarboxylate transporter substrate binding protein [Casimicrobiaceae bacterium]